MKKRSSIILVVILTLIVAIVLSVTLAVLLLRDENLFVGTKVKIVNLHFSPSNDWKSTIASFTITNLYNSKITVIGSEVNKANYGYSEITLPSGQTRNATVNLNGLVITKSSNYAVTLTVTFDDGQYEIYSQNYTPYKYVGSVFLETSVLQLIDEKAFLSLTAKNTGNIPLSRLNITVNSVGTSVGLIQFISPEEFLNLDMRPIDGTFNSGTSYPVQYTFIFADESTIIATSTLQALQFIPTPTPSPQPTRTPNPTPTASPTPTPTPTPPPVLQFTFVTTQSYVDVTKPLTFTGTLSDHTKSGQITLYYWDSKNVVNSTTTVPMTNGAFASSIQPWHTGDGTGTTCYFKLFWAGDSQYPKGVYSLTYYLGSNIIVP
jgi:hypothetical protein